MMAGVFGKQDLYKNTHFAKVIVLSKLLLTLKNFSQARKVDMMLRWPQIQRVCVRTKELLYLRCRILGCLNRSTVQ